MWGKIDPNTNLIVPDIYFSLAEETLSAGRRTREAALSFQVNIYGASLGTETLFQGPKGEVLSSPCHESSTEYKGERRQWQCSPIATEEGNYRLEISGHGVNGTTVEALDWIYDISPPQVEVHVESPEELGRDDIFYVRLKAREGSEDVDWKRSELFANGQPATHVDCFVSSGAKEQCFAVSLARLPHLPQGNYPLNLTTRLVDEINNWEEKTQGKTLKINRVLWQTAAYTGTHKHRPVVTREGWVIVQLSSTKILALDARNGGAQKWEASFAWEGNVDFILGNHQGTSVLVKTCTTNGRTGLYALNAHTGEGLTMGCLELRDETFSLALLKGGPNQDLLLVRSFVNSNRTRLETCQLTGSVSPEQMDFSCNFTSAPFSNADAVMVVRPQAGADTVIYSSSSDDAETWVAFKWGSGGALSMINGSATGRGSIFGIGPQHLWGANWMSLIDGSGKELRTEKLSHQATPWAMDVNDEVVVSGSGSYLYRYLPNLPTLAVLAQARMDWLPKAGFLMESGDLLLAGGQSSVVVLSPDFQKHWQADFSKAFGAGFELRQATLVPLSSTRSVLVLEMTKADKTVYGGILVDAPGLKTNAPWPMQGHDLCGSFNTSVAVDNCWDGPRL